MTFKQLKQVIAQMNKLFTAKERAHMTIELSLNCEGNSTIKAFNDAAEVVFRLGGVVGDFTYVGAYPIFVKSLSQCKQSEPFDEFIFRDLKGECPSVVHYLTFASKPLFEASDYDTLRAIELLRAVHGRGKLLYERACVLNCIQGEGAWLYSAEHRAFCCVQMDVAISESKQVAFNVKWLYLMQKWLNGAKGSVSVHLNEQSLYLQDEVSQLSIPLIVAPLDELTSLCCQFSQLGKLLHRGVGLEYFDLWQQFSRMIDKKSDVVTLEASQIEHAQFDRRLFERISYAVGDEAVVIPGECGWRWNLNEQSWKAGLFLGKRKY